MGNPASVTRITTGIVSRKNVIIWFVLHTRKLSGIKVMIVNVMKGTSRRVRSVWMLVDPIKCGSGTSVSVRMAMLRWMEFVSPAHHTPNPRPMASPVSAKLTTTGMLPRGNVTTWCVGTEPR